MYLATAQRPPWTHRRLPPGRHFTAAAEGRDGLTVQRVRMIKKGVSSVAFGTAFFPQGPAQLGPRRGGYSADSL